MRKPKQLPPPKQQKTDGVTGFVPMPVSPLIILIQALCYIVLVVANLALVSGSWDIEDDVMDGALKMGVVMLGIFGLIMTMLVYKLHGGEE